jgi:hypothetical protein
MEFLVRQSALILAARITLPHFSVSSEISLAKSAGEPGFASPPSSASFVLILGSVRATLIVLLMHWRYSEGAPFHLLDRGLLTQHFVCELSAAFLLQPVVRCA